MKTYHYNGEAKKSNKQMVTDNNRIIPHICQELVRFITMFPLNITILHVFYTNCLTVYIIHAPYIVHKVRSPEPCIRLRYVMRCFQYVPWTRVTYYYEP